MANAIPFKGLRYNTDKINNLSEVVTPPYDIISKDEQAVFYDKHENNVIRLEYGKEFDADNDLENRYTRAAADLKKWCDEGILKREDTDCFYLYEQKFTINGPKVSQYTYRGFISLVELEEFDKGIVLPHEETLSKAKTDRFNLMSTTHCNFSQIYCLYMDEKKTLNKLMNNITVNPADLSFVTDDGICQNVWIIKDEEINKTISDNFKDKQLFIADGHHRYETALNFRNKMREENPDWKKEDSFNYVMMMLVDIDDPGLIVLPTHRIITNMESVDEGRIIPVLKDHFMIDKIIVDRNPSALADAMEKDLAGYKNDKAFGLYLGGDYYYRLRLKNASVMEKYFPDNSDAYKNLDVNVLHTLILEKLFGIDRANLADQRNIVYTRDAAEAVTNVKKGDAQCCFILNPTKVHEIKDVALAKEKMPQKSTYFYPKLVTGIVMNQFDE